MKPKGYVTLVGSTYMGFVIDNYFVYLHRGLAKKDPVYFYWLYISLFWTQCITPVVLVILIAVNKNEDGPTLSVKVRNVLFVLKGALPQNLATRN